MYSYLFFIVCIGLCVSLMQTIFVLSFSHHIQGLAGLVLKDGLYRCTIYFEELEKATGLLCSLGFFFKGKAICVEA